MPRNSRPIRLNPVLLLLLISAILPACASSVPAPAAERALDEAEDINATGLRVGRYFGSRGLDFGDMIRFGVEVGPGLGADVMVSDYLRIAAMKRWSAGIGFQGFRRTPIKNAGEGYAFLGPMRRGGTEHGIPWYVQTWDIRVDAQAAIIGANVAVNPAEIFDFLLGWFTIDFMHDDLGVYDYYNTEGSYDS